VYHIKHIEMGYDDDQAKFAMYVIGFFVVVLLIAFLQTVMTGTSAKDAAQGVASIVSSTAKAGAGP